MAYSLIRGGNTVAGGAQCSRGGGGGGGHMGRLQRGPAARLAGHAQVCQPALPCTYSLTAGEGHARKSIFGPNPAFSAFTKAAMVGCVLYKLEAKLSRSLE